MALLRSLVLVAICFSFIERKFAESKPNIVVIMSDDAGWNDFGFRGQNQIPTPNIDALAYNGIVFNRFYTQQACTPSRFAFLTGNYPIRSGDQGMVIDGGEDRPLSRNFTTLAESLKTLGYKTHLIGKWHLGSSRRSTIPNERGFDTFFGFRTGWIGYYDYILQAPANACNLSGIFQAPSPNSFCLTGFDLHDNYRPAYEYTGRYATHVFTDKAVEIIKQSKKDPFFLFVSHLAPHVGKHGNDLEVPDEKQTDKEFSYIKDFKRRRYAGVMKELDKSVGKIVKTLADEKLLKNTIVLFLNDNGPQVGGIFENRGSSWPLRGIKFTPLEGGIRGTAIMYSPILQRKGFISNQLMHITDFYPTFYAAVGGHDYNLKLLDGINQWNSILNNEPGPRTELLVNIEEVENYSAYIGFNGQYKLINGTFDNGTNDKFLGESGRGPENPPYKIKDVLNSDVNKAVRKTEDKKQKLTTDVISSLRNRLDISGDCSELKRTATNNTVCTGVCLFNLFLDPCETTDISEEVPNIVTILKHKLEVYWPQLVPQKERFIDPAADPKYCNNTWFLWKENPPFCPVNLQSI